MAQYTSNHLSPPAQLIPLIAFAQAHKHIGDSFLLTIIPGERADNPFLEITGVPPSHSHSSPCPGERATLHSPNPAFIPSPAILARESSSDPPDARPENRCNVLLALYGSAATRPSDFVYVTPHFIQRYFLSHPASYWPKDTRPMTTNTTHQRHRQRMTPPMSSSTTNPLQEKTQKGWRSALCMRCEQEGAGNGTRPTE